MRRLRNGLLASSLVGLSVALATPVQADPIDLIMVGTWSTAPNAPNPGQVAQGGKFVIKSTHDTAAIEPVAETDRFRGDLVMGGLGVLDPARIFRAPLLGGAFELHVPLEGFNTVSVQTGADHFYIGPGFAPAAEIQFFDAAGTQLRGYEFESDFLPGTTGLVGGGLIFEMFTADVDLGGSPPQGTRVTNSSAQIINGNDLFGLDITSSTVDVRSEDSGPSGGQQNPGVFLSPAVPVVADAGPNLAYSASGLTVTTNAGTEQVTDPVAPLIPGQVRTAPSALDAQPRQADNDLGAARTDGEDFLTFEWTVAGSPLAGNQPGTRLNRVVQTGLGGPRFVNAGTRAVDDVNVSVAIEASGLTTTLDTATWTVSVTEDITGFSATDALTVSYDNALPQIANASATAQVDDILFELMVEDLDLAVNPLIADFELLEVELFRGGVAFAGLPGLTALNGSGAVNNAILVPHATLLALFGPGPDQLEVRATDRFLRDQALFASALIDFTVNPAVAGVPEPASLVLVGVGLGALGLLARRQRGRGAQ